MKIGDFIHTPEGTAEIYEMIEGVDGRAKVHVWLGGVNKRKRIKRIRHARIFNENDCREMEE